MSVWALPWLGLARRDSRMKKAALLIGNCKYPGAELVNPGNDATDLKTALDRLGFGNTTGLDGGIRDMEQALKDFSGILDGYEIALFCFAGHGMQINGCNYLAAVDTDFDTEVNAKYSSLALDLVIDTLGQADSTTNILILDACRNNPYERRWRGGESRGLAPVFAPKGTIIAFATSPGQAAADGVGRNGAYTGALLRHLQTQNISIESLFKRVRNTLSVATAGKQTSWEHTSLMGDFCFNPSKAESERITFYSEAALADGGYVPDVARPLGVAIRDLASHDWYKQNPAVAALARIALGEEDRDALFVLGRNLYQAACGEANAALALVQGLPHSLNPASEIAKQHIVDGMLFEIYFDSQGRLRRSPKSGEFENVFRLEKDPVFQPCFVFLNTALRPYADRIFYAPGSKSSVTVNAPTVEHLSGRKAIYELIFEQTNILLEASGAAALTAEQDASMTLRTVAQIKDEIAGRMVTPKRRLELVVDGVPDINTQVLFPFLYSLQRIAK